MDKKFIWAIIILMTVALFGIAVTQFVWIKAQVDLDGKSFESRTFMALNSVKAKMTKDANDKLDQMRSVEELMASDKLFGKTINTPKLLSPDNKNYLNNCLLYTSPSPRD